MDFFGEGVFREKKEINGVHFCLYLLKRLKQPTRYIFLLSGLEISSFISLISVIQPIYINIQNIFNMGM